MNMLYTENEINVLSARIQKRRIVTLLAAIPFFVLFLVVFIMHLNNTPSHPAPIPDDVLKIIGIVCMIITCFVIIFGLSFCVSPLKSYRKHMINGLQGRTHDVAYAFINCEDYESLVENVTYRTINMKGEPDRHGICEHMFYWDALKPLPDFREGEMITIRYYDRFVVGWSR